MSRTPMEWLESEQRKAELMEEAAEPADFFEAGYGAMWWLAQADGLRALLAVMLAADHLVVLTDEAE